MTAAVAYSNSFGTGSWASRDATPVTNTEVVSILSKIRQNLNSQTKKNRISQCKELLEEFNDEYVDVLSRLEGDANNASLLEARSLLLSLPDDVPLPSLIAEPDGAVGMEWYKDRRNAFVIAVRGNKTLEFASVYGFGNRQHGKVNYLDSLPRSLAIDLNRFLKR